MSDELKQNVPDHIKEKAREMARQELQRRLEELDMSHSEAKGYGQLLSATQAHIASLLDLLERNYPCHTSGFLRLLSSFVRSRGQGGRAGLGETADRRRARRHPLDRRFDRRVDRLQAAWHGEAGDWSSTNQVRPTTGLLAAAANKYHYLLGRNESNLFSI